VLALANRSYLELYSLAIFSNLELRICNRLVGLKDVLELVKGKSGFAASGETVAKKYNPTLT